MVRKPDMNEIVNDRGETRAECIKRVNEAADKLAAVLSEAAASLSEVDSIFEKAKNKLCVRILTNPGKNVPSTFYIETDTVKREITITLPIGQNQLVLPENLACFLTDQLVDQTHKWHSS